MSSQAKSKSPAGTSTFAFLRPLERENGASMAEFAVILPVLIMVLFGIIEFGIAFTKAQAIEASAREGARLASIEGSSVADVGTRVNDALFGIQMSGPPTITVNPGPCQDRPGEKVTVSVSTDHVISIPFASELSHHPQWHRRLPMRGISMNRLFFRLTSSDTGAAMPFVAVSLLVIFGMAALTIDLGNGWRIRRALIPASDAAALAAAQDYAQGLDGCATVAGTFVTDNEPAATMDLCDPQPLSGSNGYVTVTASHNVQTWFAPVIGLGDYAVGSSTTAAWGDPSAASGLRPMGLCLPGDADLEYVIRNPSATATEIVVEYTKEHPNDCGSTDGNWGTIDLDGDGNSHNDMVQWIIDGYPGLIEFEDHVVTSCVDAHCYEGDTGADLAGAQQQLRDLRDSGQYFTLPLFNFVEGQGANAKFHLAGLARVQLLDFRVVGNESSRFLRLLVQPGFVSGVPGGSGSGTGGNKVVSICAVDATNAAGCTP